MHTYPRGVGTGVNPIRALGATISPGRTEPSDRAAAEMRKPAASFAVLAVVLLLLTSAGCGKKPSNTKPSSSGSILSTEPVKSTLDIGAIRGKTNRAAVAADLRAEMASGQTAGLYGNDPATQKSAQEIYAQAVQKVAAKYGVTAADIEDVAREFGVAP